MNDVLRTEREIHQMQEVDFHIYVEDNCLKLDSKIMGGVWQTELALSLTGKGELSVIPNGNFELAGDKVIFS